MFDETKNENGAASNVVEPPAPMMDPILMSEAVKAGVVSGLRHSKTNPKMNPYIAMTRSGVEVFDLSRTLEVVEQASLFLREAVKSGKSILVVGTTPPARGLVKIFAEKFLFPSVTTRWLGGTLTNFQTIRTRVDYYLKLKTDKAMGRLEKYTKKERVLFDKQIEKMSVLFGGLENLKELPKGVLVIDASHHDTAVREANRLSIPIVAIMNTDSNPDRVAYPVPANDRARSSIAWLLQKFETAIEAGLEERKQILASPPPESSK